jgi:hypothetical protein
MGYKVARTNKGFSWQEGDGARQERGEGFVEDITRPGEPRSKRASEMACLAQMLTAADESRISPHVDWQHLRFVWGFGG